MDLDSLDDEDAQALADRIGPHLEPGSYGDRVVLSRRQAIGLAGGTLGAGALLSLGVDPAVAQAAGSVGTSSEPVDVFGYDVDVANSLAMNGNPIENAGSVNADEGTIGPQLSHVTTLSDAALGRPHDIEIRGGLGLTAGKDGNVCVIDLHPRDNPTVAASNSSFTDAQTVAWYPGTHPKVSALIGDNDSLTSVLALGRAVGAGIDSTATVSTEINGAVWYRGEGEFLITAQKGGQVESFNVTDFDAKTSAARLDTTISNPHDVTILGTRVITCGQGDGATPKLESISSVINSGDETASGNPATDATFSDAQLNGANRLASLGPRTLVVANNYVNTIATVDVPDTTDGTTWSVSDTAATGASDGPSGLDVVGDYAITSSSDRVTLWDLSEPANITQIDQHVFGTTISGHDMAVEGRYCYVTGQATDTIEVFDLGWEFARDVYADELTTGSA